MNPGDRFLEEVRRLQKQSAKPASGPRFRRFTTPVIEMPDQTRRVLFPTVPPEAVEVTLIGMDPDRVVFIDDLGRDLMPAHPLRYRVFKRDEQLCLAAGIPGSKWRDAVVIPFTD